MRNGFGLEWTGTAKRPSQSAPDVRTSGPGSLTRCSNRLSHEPFDLVSADYLSLLTGKGGFKTVLLITDTFSNFVWVYKLKSAGTGKMMLMGLQDLCLHYRQLDTFMTDSQTPS